MSTGRDPAERDKLVLAHLWLVQYVAGRLLIGLPPRTDRRELESYGVIGLLDAAERFDCRPDARFEAYAIPWIRGAILAGLKVSHWSPALVRRVKQMEAAAAELEARLGRPPGAAELAARLGLTLRQLAQRQREAGLLAVLSLDEAVADGEETALHERVADPGAPDPELEAIGGERRRLLAAALAALPEKERRVVELFYYEGLSVTEIARVLHLSAARVSQLHSKAICRLRGRLGRLKAALV